MAESKKLRENMRKRIRKADIVLIGILLIISLAFFFLRYTKGSGAQVRVTVDGALYGTYALDVEQTVPIETDGVVTNTFIIKDGQADMTEANCPDKLCIHQHAISRQGETIVCLPNKIVVEVESEQQSEFDSFAK